MRVTTPKTMGCVWTLAAVTAACNPLEVTYIGSAGYMLESPDKKLLIDAPFDVFVQQFEVPVANQTTQDRIANAEEPFDDVDLVLMTHSHRGHFDFQLLGSCMKNNPDAKLVSTLAVRETLASGYADFDAIADRIVVPNLENDYETTDIVVNGVDIHVSRAPHWGEEGYLYNYGFQLGGYEILYLLEEENYAKTNDIDLLFGGTPTSSLEPDHIFLTHQYGHATIAELARELSTTPDVTFLTTSMANKPVTRGRDGAVVVGTPDDFLGRSGVYGRARR